MTAAIPPAQPATDRPSPDRPSPGSDAATPAVHAPIGSRLDLEQSRRPSRKPWRRVKGWLSSAVVRVAAWVIPRLYTGYCRLVWATSRIEGGGREFMEAVTVKHGRFVALLWHQEVFTVAWSWRRHGGYTLASVGNFGRIITRMLERCGFQVFRGGSSTGTRRKLAVVPVMTEHMLRTPDPVLYGVTVDGSHGPPFRLKIGMLRVARACRAPIVLARCWYARRLELPTWDRTGFPLPFNRISQRMIGPYWIPPDASTADLERHREFLEAELNELAALSYEDVDRRPFDPPPGFPAGFRRRWHPRSPGLAMSPHDHALDDPPPWACRAGEPIAAPAPDDEA